MIEVGHKVFFLREVGRVFGLAGGIGFEIISITDLVVMFFTDPPMYKVACLD